MKRVNSPSFDSTSIFPSCFSSIMDRVIDSPKPVPSPTGFVVKNAENICSRIFSGIPIPLSSILNLKESPSFRRSTDITGSYPIGVAGFTALTALNTTEDPSRASIPFDAERGGFIMGEGAGVVVLESLEHAQARGAKIYAELAGYGATGDAYHITSPAEDGSGAAKAMEMAIADAGMKPEDVDYINAHGTSTHHNDLFETKAIKLALGDHAYKTRINSTKSMIGHLLGAAGGVEFITCVKSIQEGFVHATAGLEKDDPECDLDYCKGEGVQMDVNCAISNSLGFGGHNATLLVKKFEA